MVEYPNDFGSLDEGAAEFDWSSTTERLRTVGRYWPALVAAVIVGGAAGYGASFAVRPTFQSSTLFIPPQQQSALSPTSSSLGALSSLVGGPSVKSSTDQYISMLESVTVSDHIITRFGLMKEYDAEYQDQARKKLAKLVQITSGKKDGLIRVDVEDVGADRAADIANQYVEELRGLMSHLAVTEAQQRRTFFEKLLVDTKDKLTAAQVALEGSGFDASSLKAEPRSAANTYASLRAELTAAQVRLDVMRTTMAETSSDVRSQLTAVNALASRLGQVERSEAPSTGTPDYVGKYREFKYQETLFDLYSRQYELARLDESREGALVQVIDPAQRAEHKFAPHRSSFAVAGAVLTMLLAFLILWRRSAPDIALRR